MRILVVEDQKKIAAFIEKGLSQHGFTVLHCDSGEEGFFYATTESFDSEIKE